MFFSKIFKTLIYIIVFVLILSFLIPICTYAIDEDSIYVWSNNSSAISTSNTSDLEKAENETDIQNNSRKLSRYNIR